MKLSKLLIGIALGLGLSLSSAANTTDTTTAVPTKQRIKINPFHSLDISTVGRVTVKQGPKCTMHISGTKRLMSIVKFDVKNGMLRIYFPDGIRNVNTRNEELNINITAPTLSRIDFNGVGRFTCDSTMRLSNDLEIITNGVGDLYVEDLHCKSLDIEINGVGKADINVHCEHKLNAEVNGIGSLTLSGYTPSLRTDRNGIGRINKRRMQVGN